jgi:YHS domain-containing protein
VKNKLLLFIFLSCLSAFGFAVEPVSTGYFNDTAITGHNVIAYHGLSLGDKAIKGDNTYTEQWKGANWYFNSEEERERFKASPESYAPAYNGFCANALSLGEGLIRTSGEHWAVFEDQLYVFYAARGAERWLQDDYSAYKVIADREWAAIIQKPRAQK